MLENEFSDLKSALNSESFLKAPHFDKPFILQTDAILRRIGGVLSQMFDKKRKKKQSHITKKTQ